MPAIDTCNAKLPRRDGYCLHPAGWGTNHLGEGRCKLHGGSNTGPRITTMDKVNAKQPLKYSPFLSDEKQKDLYEKILGDKTLDDEIAICRVRIAELLEFISTWRVRLTEQIGTLPPEADSRELSRFMSRNSQLFSRLDTLQRDLKEQLDVLAKIVERDQRIRESGKYLIDIRGLAEYASKQMIVVQAVCRDCPRRQELSEKFKLIKISSAALPPMAKEIVEKAEDQEAEVIASNPYLNREQEIKLDE